MRIPLLCALVVLCGAEGASAQQWPAYVQGGYSQGYAPTYPTAPRSPGYYPYPQNGVMPATSYYYYPVPNSYPGYPNPGNVNGHTTYSYAVDPACGSGTWGNYYPYPRRRAAPAPRHGGLAGKLTAPPPPPAPLLADPAAEAVHEKPADPPRAPGEYHRPCKETCWVNAEYVLSWFRRGGELPPLVTVGANPPLADRPGALGQPGTAVIFGGESPDLGTFSGIRAEAGFFLDSEDRLSLDWNGLLLFPNTLHFEAASDAQGNLVIARPFFSAITGREAALVDAIPGNFTGGVTADLKSEMLGFEVNGRYHTYCQECLHLDALAGFRYLRLAESLTMRDRLIPLVAPSLIPFQGTFISPPDQLVDEDSFRTTNQFYGLQLGGRLRWEQEWYYLSVFGKVAVGATEERVDINGSTTLVSPNGNQFATGGIFALPTNIGQFRRSVVGLVPEGGVNIGAEATKHLRLSAGYSFLYWRRVVRPGPQIDRVLNTSQVPGSPNFGLAPPSQNPTFNFKDEPFFVHSLNFGVEVHF